MRLTETIEARGHPNVRATHKTTLEITRERSLTLRGDCIIAVESSKAVADLSPKLKKLIRTPGSRVTMLIEAGGLGEVLTGRGDPSLPLTSQTSLVVRKSSFICDRTLMISANKSAGNLSRNLVKALQKSDQKVLITLVVEL